MNVIKIGPYYFNMDLIAEVRDTGVDVEIFFSGTEKATTLRGAEAEKFRQWLDGQSKDLNGPA